MTTVALITTVLAVLSVWAHILCAVMTPRAEARLIRALARRVTKRIEEGYFVTWRDLCLWYVELVRAILGFDSATLEPREARAALTESERQLRSSGPFSELSKAILDNAKRSLPEGIEVNRPHGVGRTILLLAGTIGIFVTIGPPTSKWIFVWLVAVVPVLCTSTFDMFGALRVLSRARSISTADQDFPD